MTTLNKSRSLYCGSAFNELNDGFVVSINPGRPGLSGYGLRFYVANGGTLKRLSKARKEYKVLDVYEDCEIGSVDVLLGGVHYRFDFGHDGNEPFTASVEVINN